MFGPHGGVLGAWDCGWPPGEKVAGGTGNSGFLPSLLKNERNFDILHFLCWVICKGPPNRPIMTLPPCPPKA